MTLSETKGVQMAVEQFSFERSGVIQERNLMLVEDLQTKLGTIQELQSNGNWDRQLLETPPKSVKGSLQSRYRRKLKP